jgi:hypothetical protein
MGERGHDRHRIERFDLVIGGTIVVAVWYSRCGSTVKRNRERGFAENNAD